MDELEELYQEIILDHSKHPRNYGALETATHIAQGHNPLCGDRLTLRLAVANGLVSAAAFEAKGCAISKASASLMTEQLKGKSVEEAIQLTKAALTFLRGEGEPELPEVADALSALAGVKKFPMRVKCATLAWHALESALTDPGSEVTTE